MLFNEFDEFYMEFKKIWNNIDIAIICGERVFSDIEYNIFNNASSIEYLYCPSKNAFDQYDEILSNAKKISKNKLIITILGPTAKVLVFDLQGIGYRALDLGHLAKDYNAYKKKIIKNKISIGKFFEPD